MATDNKTGIFHCEKDTKVIALRAGYSDVLREPGDIFYVKKGTNIGPNSWISPVAEDSVTTEESENYDKMTISEIKIALAKKGVDFAGITKKTDLIELLSKADAEDELA